MTINYEKLWNLLDAQGISRDQLRKAAGLTTYVFEKIEKNHSVQIDALIKVCGALNCKIKDIVEIEYDYDKKRAIPNIDFSDLEIFSVGEQFEHLGFNTLYDFPINLNVVSLQNFLVEQLESAKLSALACDELITALKDRGISICLPDGVEPSLDKLPKEVAEIDGEYDPIPLQQIANYLSWVFYKHTKEHQTLAARLAAIREKRNPKQYYVERGIFHAPRNGRHFAFEGLSETIEPDIYPFSILPHIFGSLGSTDVYVLSHRIPDITDFIEEVVNASPDTALLFSLKVKLGLRNEEILQFLGLPSWQSLLVGIENCSAFRRSIRKMRHPRYARSLRGQWMEMKVNLIEDFETSRIGKGMNPYEAVIPSCTDKIYTQFVDTIKNRVNESIQNGVPFFDALKLFYPKHIVAATEQNVAIWYDSTVPVADQIKLSWKTYQALKMVGIETISQVLQRHGSGNSLDEQEKTGLWQVPGFEDLQIAEILQGLKSLLVQPMDRGFVDNMVDFAERACKEQGNWPIYECIGITHSVLKLLLNLQYRDVDEVIADYKSGTLQEKCQSLAGTKEYTELFDCIRMVETGEYPMTHIIFSDFWGKHLRANIGSLEEMRMAYLHDQPMQYGVKEIDANIDMLFPGESEAFRLLYNTRGCHMKWVPWPIDTLTFTVFSCIDSGNQIEILDAFYGLDATFFTSNYEPWPTMGDVVYIFAKVLVDGKIQYNLYRMLLGELKSIEGINQDFLASLFASVSFNAKICYNPKQFSKNFKEQFSQSLGYFCMRAIACTNKESVQDLTDTYKYYIDRCQDKIASRVSQIKCYEAQFTISTENIIKSAGINDMSTLVRMDISDFLNISGIRERHIAEIIRKAQTYGVIIPSWEKWLANYRAKPVDYLDMTIEELDLSVRSYNCLKRGRVVTVEDLLLLSYDGLMKIRNMGKKSLTEIEKKLESLGISLDAFMQTQE